MQRSRGRTRRFTGRYLSVLFIPLLFCALFISSSGDIQPTTSKAFITLLTTPAPAPAWPNDGAIDHPMVSGGCGVTPSVAPGTTSQQSLAVHPNTNEGFSTRTYWVHVPQGYTASQPTPLVLVFHGGGGTGIDTEKGTGFSPFADHHHFLVVYPQGLPYNALGTGYTTWAATGPLDLLTNGGDDLLFISNLLDALQQHYCIDPQRIYATGFSAGGGMTWFLTCGLTGRIAASPPTPHKSSKPHSYSVRQTKELDSKHTMHH